MENNTYKQVAKTTGTIISLTDMKLYLKQDESADDGLIIALITVAEKTAEKIMGRDLLTAVYENYRSDIDSDLTLRRAKFLSVSAIQYMNNGVYNNVDPADYNVASNGIYGKIWEIELPDSYDDHPEAIKIVFSAGFGATGTDIPEDIKTAIKAHVAYMYENRGDCIDVEGNLPVCSKLIYTNYKVIDISGVM